MKCQNEMNNNFDRRVTPGFEYLLQIIKSLPEKNSLNVDEKNYY